MRYLSHGLEKLEKKSARLTLHSDLDMPRLNSLKGGLEAAGPHGPTVQLRACRGSSHIAVMRCNQVFVFAVWPVSALVVVVVAPLTIAINNNTKFERPR